MWKEGLESPLGVAAGPHTQLAQNIVACYAGGARFIELKTVQVMYGEELEFKNLVFVLMMRDITLNGHQNYML